MDQNDTHDGAVGLEPTQLKAIEGVSPLARITGQCSHLRLDDFTAG